MSYYVRPNICLYMIVQAIFHSPVNTLVCLFFTLSVGRSRVALFNVVGSRQSLRTDFVTLQTDTT